MKKCPTCDKTFEDSMRFCQVDGTSLVDEEPAFDPYATMIGQPGMSIPIQDESKPVESQPEDPGTESNATGSMAISAPDEVLDLPEADPLKTMYVSDDEMKAALGKSEPDAEPEIIEISPVEDKSEPEAPSFTAPDVPAPSFEDVSPPPSPFTASNESERDEPSFPEPAPAPPVFEEPLRSPAFDEAATVIQPSYGASPFDQPAPAAAWTPPPAPDASWQNQQIGSNTPFQPPPAGAGGENKTLAIISLVCGILGMTVCCGSFLVSVAALVLGIMARNKASQNPNEYGGAGLAMGGIITGALGLVASLIFIIFYLVVGIASIPLS